MGKATVLRANECENIQTDWGELTWYASGKLGNSADLTLGKCVIKPNCANPMHSHPNCSEILVVQQGTIMHSIEDGREVEMTAGDVIALPPNLPHNARNTSGENAVLLIAFTAADREVIGE